MGLYIGLMFLLMSDFPNNESEAGTGKDVNMHEISVSCPTVQFCPPESNISVLEQKGTRLQFRKSERQRSFLMELW